MNFDKNNAIVFASLLHDIGKLIQRAENSTKSQSETGFEYINSTQNVLLKEKDILNSIKYLHSESIKDADLPCDNISYIVFEADKVAVGSDNIEKFENNNSALKAVFNRIGKPTDYSYLLKDFNTHDEPNYPVSVTEKATKEQYSLLKSQIDKNINSIETPNALLQLFETTISFIPSSTNLQQAEDISLYDHVKLTSAIASCMYQYFQEHEITDYKNYASKDSRDTNYYTLASFDLSGIQDFIYTITSEKALKSLRGRSFYLEFILQHICDELLEKLNLSKANLLYSGGGHCYLLLPNTDFAKETIKSCVETVNNWFLDNFSTALYISYGLTESSSNELMNSSNEIFKRVSKALSKNKINRYSKTQLEKIFDVGNSKAEMVTDEKECKICKSTKTLSEDNICRLCASLIELGKYLTGGDELLICVSDTESKYSVELPSIAKEKRYLDIKVNSELDYKKYKHIYTINKWNSNNSKNISNLWLGNYSCDETVDFLELSQRCQGIKRLGVLRADVDNLGTIFSSGFSKEYASISRITTLSRQLSMFFKYYINKLCKGLNVVIVYSGGDDVFVVGSWNDVIILAQKLREAFKKYTCDKLSFSCGIGLFTPKYPVNKMAELTGYLEEFAKSNEGKNSIAILGEDTNYKGCEVETTRFVFTWDKFNELYSKIEDFKSHCYFDEEDLNKGNKILLSTSMLYRIINLITSDNSINIARLAYSLARFEPPNTSNSYNHYKYIKDFIYTMYKTDRHTLLTILNLIVYENRKS